MTPEAQVGEILVRVGLSVGAVAIAVTALVIAVRTRTTDYPSKLANKLAALDADVSGFDLKLAAAMADIKAIRGKINQSIRKQGAEAAAAGGDPAAAEDLVAESPKVVDKVLWSRMNKVQRQGMLDQGYQVAG